MNLVVCDVPVSMNKQGLFSLNDFHKAAGGEEKDKPSNWLRLDKTEELISEYSNSSDLSNKIISSKSGRYGGTYVCEELIYAYASWISPKFYKMVLDTFKQAMDTERKRIASREKARVQFPIMTDAIKYHYEERGKIAKSYHYCNECNMINKIAAGHDAKELREMRDIPKSGATRDYFNAIEMADVEFLQSTNAAYIEEGLSFEERKIKLTKLFQRIAERRLKKLGKSSE